MFELDQCNSISYDTVVSLIWVDLMSFKDFSRLVDGIQNALLDSLRLRYSGFGTLTTSNPGLSGIGILAQMPSRILYY